MFSLNNSYNQRFHEINFYLKPKRYTNHQLFCNRRQWRKEALNQYETLTDVVNNIPTHNIVIECGDFNDLFSENLLKYTYHKTTNRTSELKEITRYRVTL